MVIPGQGCGICGANLVRVHTYTGLCWYGFSVHSISKNPKENFAQFQTGVPTLASPMPLITAECTDLSDGIFVFSTADIGFIVSME